MHYFATHSKTAPQTIKQSTAAKERRSSRGTVPAETPNGGLARIPGVRIAHIGGRITAVEPIQAYWHARGAVFMHHSLDPAEPQGWLEEVLERSHIVFHARA